jgi:hypothetical protein
VTAYAYDEDAMHAGLDLVRRSGARSCEFGYLEDDVPIERARWWAYADFAGTRIQVDELSGPVEAVEALGRKLLHGAKCRRCGGPIRLDDRDDGCRWTRKGKRWEPGCGKPIDQSIPHPMRPT